MTSLLSLFDPTGWVRRVSDFVAQKGHAHDKVCFYGTPFAHDEIMVQTMRTRYARMILRFYQMNHFGLASNCASFAQYLKSGQVFPLQCSNLMQYHSDMYLYQGQHIAFGDVICLFYFREEVFDHVYEIRRLFPAIFDLFLEKSEDSKVKDILLRLSHRKNLLVQKFSYTEIGEMTEGFIFKDFHFLTCVGYESNPKTGNIEPIFVNQNGRNTVLAKDKEQIYCIWKCHELLQ